MVKAVMRLAITLISHSVMLFNHIPLMHQTLDDGVFLVKLSLHLQEEALQGAVNKVMDSYQLD